MTHATARHRADRRLADLRWLVLTRPSGPSGYLSMLRSRRRHAQEPVNFDCTSWLAIPVEPATSKSAGDEHAAAGEPMRPGEVGWPKPAGWCSRPRLPGLCGKEGQLIYTGDMLVSLFIPCFVDQMTPQVGLAVANVLERLGHTCEFRAAQKIGRAHV